MLPTRSRLSTAPRVAACILSTLVLLGSGAIAQDACRFALTRGLYSENSDIAAAVRQEFGPGATVADWNDVKAQFGGSIANFCDAVGLPSYRSSALCVRGGARFWSGNRHYFVQRHDGRVPGGWLVHDHIDSYTLSLGSWYDRNHPVLVALPTASCGSVVLYGSGCDGSRGVPGIGHSGAPRLAGTLSLELTSAAPAIPRILELGMQPLDLSLEPLGAPRCRLLVDPLIGLGGITSDAGTAAETIAVPADPGIVGLVLYAQFALLDSAANTLGVALSNAARITIGAR